MSKHEELMEAVAKAEAEYAASNYWNAAVPFEQQVIQGKARLRLSFNVREARQILANYERNELHVDP